MSLIDAIQQWFRRHQRVSEIDHDMREITRSEWNRAMPPAAPEPTPDPVVMAAEMKAYHAEARAEQKMQDYQASVARYNQRGGVLAEADAILATLTLKEAVPPAVQDIVQRGVATIREQEERHCLWCMGGLPLPSNPFTEDIGGAWAAEIERRMNTLYQRADMATLADMERRAKAGTLRLDIDLIIPNTFVWQRFARADADAQRLRLAIMIGAILAEVMGMTTLDIATSIKGHSVEDLSSYGWSFGLYDDAEGMVA